MKRVITMFLLVFFMISIGSAFEFDNVKSFEEKGDYGKITIRNGFGFLGKLAEYELTNNTDRCYRGCSAQGIATLHKADQLFKGFRFTDENTNDRTLNYQIYISEADKKVSKTVKKFETQCANKLVKRNSTQLEQVCSEVYVGDETIPNALPDWQQYEFDTLPKGEYLWKIEATKKGFETIDWIGNAFGKEFGEWAFWIGVDPSLYYKMNQTGTEDFEDFFGNKNMSQIVGSFSPGKLGNGGNASGGLAEEDGWESTAGNDNYSLGAGDFTIALWIKKTITNPGSLFMDFGASNAGGWGMQYGSGGESNFFLWNEGGATRLRSDSAINNGDWNRVVISRIGSTLKLYRNDTEEDSISFSTEMTDIPATATFHLGGNALTNYDDFQIFKGYGWTSADVSLDWNGGLGIEADDDIAPQVNVTLLSPVNDSNISTTSIQFNATLAIQNQQTNITNATLHVWYFDNETLRDEIENLTITANTQVNATWTVTNFADGTYKWNVFGCSQNNETGATHNCTFQTTNFSFQIDTTPPILNFTTPNNTVITHTSGTNLTFNWTINDTNLDLVSCRLEFNGQNHSVGCELNGTTLNATEYNNATATFFVNDTFGNTASQVNVWAYDLFIEENRFPGVALLEGATSSFAINVSYNHTKYSSISGTLIFNETRNLGTIFGSSLNVEFNRTISMPLVTASTDFDFVWEFNLANSSTNLLINSTNNTQTVDTLSIDDCGTNANILYNFTLNDEATLDLIVPDGDNTTIEITINISALDGSLIANFSQNYTKINPAVVCFSQNLTTDYLSDAIIRYDSDTHVNEFFVIQNSSINQNILPINISLFDLKTIESQEFLVTFKSAEFVVVRDAIIDVTREYIGEGVFRTVERPITNRDGQTIVHLVLSDVRYTIIVSKFGQILGTFENVLAFCDNVAIGDCKLNLNALSSFTDPTDFETVYNIGLNLQIDRPARQIDLLFTKTDGNPSLVQLNGTRFDAYGNTSICSVFTTTTSGTLTCEVGQVFGNTTIMTQSYVDGILVDTSFFSMGDSASSIFLGLRVFMLLILFMTIPLMLITSGTGVLIGLVIGGIIAIMLNVVDSSILSSGSGITWLIIAVIILLWKISKREEGV